VSFWVQETPQTASEWAIDTYKPEQPKRDDQCEQYVLNNHVHGEMRDSNIDLSDGVANWYLETDHGAVSKDAFNV